MKRHILGLYTTIYHVRDLNRAREWYANLLGEAPYFDQPFYIGFNVAGYELGLIPIADTKRNEQASVSYWGVKEMTAACLDLEAKGLALFEPVTEVGGGI